MPELDQSPNKRGEGRSCVWNRVERYTDWKSREERKHQRSEMDTTGGLLHPTTPWSCCHCCHPLHRHANAVAVDWGKKSEIPVHCAPPACPTGGAAARSSGWMTDYDPTPRAEGTDSHLPPSSLERNWCGERNVSPAAACHWRCESVGQEEPTQAQQGTHDHQDPCAEEAGVR